MIIKEPIFVYKSTAAAAQAKNAWGPEESVSYLYNKALYLYIYKYLYECMYISMLAAKWLGMGKVPLPNGKKTLTFKS